MEPGERCCLLRRRDSVEIKSPVLLLANLMRSSIDYSEIYLTLIIRRYKSLS